MKLAGILLVLALAAGAQASGPSRKLHSVFAKADFVCPGAGYYAVGSCSANYYNCPAKGVKPPYSTCRDGLVWDPTITTCNYPEQVAACNPEGVCKGKGLFPMTKTACSSFFKNCAEKGAMAIVQECPGDLYYDKTSKTCEEYEDVPACCDPICADGPGRYPVPGKPAKYDECYVECGKHVRMTCPDGKVFNPSTQKCVFP